MNIANRVIWILRPADSGDSLVRLIRQYDGVPVHVPMTRIHPVSSEIGRRRLLACSDYDCLIFVSRNALTGARAILGSWPPDMCRMPVFSPGTATGSCLRREGFLNVTEAADDGGGETLLQTGFLTGGRLAGLNVLIVRGRDGREWLRDRLLDRGAARVDYADVYYREKLAYDIVEMKDRYKKHPPDSVLIHSATALTHLRDITPEEYRRRLLGTTAVVLSERLRRHARDLGFTGRIRISDGAGDESYLKALVSDRRER